MTEIARMKFKSNTNPKESGVLVLSDDGTFAVQPSDALREEMSRLEEVALKRSQTYGIGLGVGLIVLGTLIAGAGWLFGRIFGKLGASLSAPRSIEEVHVWRTEGGSIHLRMRGEESKIQVIQMGWNADEYLETEAALFLAEYDKMKQTGSAPPSTR